MVLKHILCKRDVLYIPFYLTLKIHEGFICFE